MLKCALIIPSWVPEEIFTSKTSSSQINYWEPLGTLYIASSMLKAGHDVKFLNGAFMTNAEILNHVSRYKPEFVGIYSTTFGWNKAMQMAFDIKEINRDIFVSVGGPYPIAIQEKCLEESICIDAVITGEGEITGVEILERLSQGKGLEGIKGVVFRQGQRIIKNPPMPLITELDSLPFPARELLGDVNRYIPPPAT